VADQLIGAYKEFFTNGGNFNTIVAARSFGQQILGLAEKIDRTHSKSKLVEESIEAALIELSRELVATSSTTGEAFDRLVNLHDRMPILSSRTSRSMAQQAYSTPIPLAYAASCLAGIDENTTVYEPAAGHGALLLGADPAKVWVNEIYQQRADELEKIYPNVLVQDATKLRPGTVPKVDVVITNPPFGVVRSDGVVQRWKIGTYGSTQIDHAIAWYALQNLKNDGRAVLILGAPMAAKLAKDDAAFLEAYATQDKVFFYQTLLASYNVTQHYQINGELYRKQGTDFPVDMVVIEGRGASKRSPPSIQAPTKIRDWNELKEVFDSARTINTGLYLGSESRSSRPGQPFLDRGGQQANRNIDSGSIPRSDVAAMLPTGTERGVDSRIRGSSREHALDNARLGDERSIPGLGRSVELADPILRPDSMRSERPNLSGMAPSESNLPSDDDSNYAVSERESVELQSPGLGGNGNDRSSINVNLTTGSKPMADNQQVQYIPQSKGNALGTLIPQNMRDQTARALQGLESSIGMPIDDWVAEQLRWPVDHIQNVLAAEQIDAVALAIQNFQSGDALVLGDQTGNGKGRVIAALMRYAQINNLIPMFVTERPGLYADIIRDCQDVGVDIDPLPTNNSLKLSLSENGESFLRTPGAEKHHEVMREIANSGVLPEGKNALFSTYAQMQTVAGKNTDRRDAMKALAPRSLVIFDESHNAGGSEKQAYRQAGLPSNRAEFAREIIEESALATFSSATYAKNLTTLSLYIGKTPLRKIVDSPETLLEIIQEGGVPLQQVMASQMAETGVYLRRERTFDGVVFNSKTVEIDIDVADKVSAAMATIVSFDLAKQEAIKAMRKDMKASGRFMQNDTSTGESSIKSVNFTALMHNVVGQYLLSQKSAGIAQEAITALANGQKPVITLSNTMGSIIEEYAGKYGLDPGEDMDVNFAAVLTKYLERTREIIVRTSGGTTRERLTDDQLGSEACDIYEQAQEAIEELKNVDIPLSPIDYIKAEITKAGYKVGEITGRTHTLQYGEGLPKYIRRGGQETSANAKNDTVNRFNDGQLDVLVINRSASSGLSLHSSERFQDQRPRHMILGQAEADINVYMQLLGRVNRTGQVNKPEYTIMAAGIPAEKRLTANLMRKMASLNANATGDRDSVHSVQGLDFFNFLGDLAVAQIISERPDLNARMGLPIDISEDENLDMLDLDGMVLKVTGRIPLLPVSEQQELYGLIESEYASLLQRERAMGRDPLSAPNLDLRASLLAQAEVIESREDLAGVMGAGAYAQMAEVNVIDKPLTQLQLVNNMLINMDQPIIDELESSTVQDVIETGLQRSLAIRNDLETIEDRYTIVKTTPFDKKIALAEEIGDKEAIKVAKYWKDDTSNKISKGSSAISRQIQFHPIGQSIDLFYKGERHKGVIGNYSCKESSVANPVSPNRWKIQIFLADGGKEISLPLSVLNQDAKRRTQKHAEISASSETSYHLFDERQADERETRVIITGNILRAYQLAPLRGALVNFSTENGETQAGILMPKGWNYTQSLNEVKVPFPDAERAVEFMAQYQSVLKTSDNCLSIFADSKAYRASNTYTVQVAIVSNRAKYEEIAREFNTEGFTMNSSGTAMSMRLSPEDTQKFADRLYQEGHILCAPEDDHRSFDSTRRSARQFLGKGVPEFAPVAEENEPIEQEAAQLLTTLEAVDENFDLGVGLNQAIEDEVEKLDTAIQAIAGEDLEQPTVGDIDRAIEDEAERTEATIEGIVTEHPDIEAAVAEVLQEPTVVEANAEFTVSLPAPDVEEEATADQGGLLENAIQSIDEYDTSLESGLIEPTAGVAGESLDEGQVKSSFQAMNATFAKLKLKPPFQVDRSLPTTPEEQPEDPLFADLPAVENEETSATVVPTRGELMSFYKAAIISEAPGSVTAKIIKYGQAQVAGVPVEQRTDDYINPGLSISREEYAEWAAMVDSVVSPTRGEISRWYIAAQMLGSDESALNSIRSIGEQQIAGTPEAAKSPQDRDIDFVNPEFRLSWEQVESRSLTMKKFLQPSRQEIITWYKSALKSGQPQSQLDAIKDIGERQIAGTSEAAKDPRDRDANFVNPAFRLSWGEAKTMRQSIGVAPQPEIAIVTTKGFER
jgi:C-terminal domain on Strawberry notch homologue/P-loop containing NTP hydrolase pore-1